MTRPLCVELFAGTFGWSAGWLALGGWAVGFDLEHMPWHGDVPAGANLVLQDVRTLHGKQLKDALLILASSPCPEYSYMAMPFGRGKQIERALHGRDVFPDGYTGSRSIEELNFLFNEPRRLQREAIEANGGRYIPLIQENVRGAEKWVGKAAWRFNSFYLWGDVPALMPIIPSRAKVPGLGAGWRPPGHPDHKPGVSFNTAAESGIKNTGGSPGQKQTNNNPTRRGPHLDPNHPAYHGNTGVKIGGDWFSDPASPSRTSGSKSAARRAASAAIARIPFELSRHIAECYYPHGASEAA